MKAAQRRARVLGADDQMRLAGRVWLSIVVGLEQLLRFGHRLGIARRNREAAAVLDVEPGEVEAVKVQHRIGDQELRVIANQVVRGSRHGDAGGEQPLFELAQPRLAAPVGVRDQRTDGDAALDRGGQRFLDLVVVETKDEDIDRLSRELDDPDDRRDACLRLDDELHSVPESGVRERCH